MKFTKPNFKNCILNISASFAKYLGAKNNNITNKLIDKALKDDYKNIVFIIFDGMGINPININLAKNSFIKNNIKDKITSVFPSTTTCATTTFLTNKTPLEHGWFGWSMYFEEINQLVDLYLSRNSETKEKIDDNFLNSVLPITPYYSNITKDYTVSRVVPKYWHDGNENNRYCFDKTEEMFDYIKNICNNNGKQFLYCYCDEPDYTMHKFGVTSNNANGIINQINTLLEKLSNDLKDTLIVVSADHGHIDVADYIDIYKDKKLYSMLKQKPYLEPLATAFMVKKEYLKEFKNHFNITYGKDFKLYKTTYLIKKGYFGNKISPNVKYLGDYISVSKNRKMFYFYNEEHLFKGHHTSLGKEMWVPLIIIKT